MAPLVLANAADAVQVQLDSPHQQMQTLGLDVTRWAGTDLKTGGFPAASPAMVR